MNQRPIHISDTHHEEHQIGETHPDRHTRYKLDKAAPRALVIHCADPRFQTAFRHFVTEELGFNNYTPLVLGGGPHSFGIADSRPESSDALLEQVRVFLDLQKVKHLVIINHENCLWYEQHKHLHPTIPPREKALSDLRAASAKLREDFPEIDIRAYWAALDGDSVHFVEK